MPHQTLKKSKNKKKFLINLESMPWKGKNRHLVAIRD
jgi:hypothetical protein